MTEKKNSDIMVTQQGGVIKNIMNQMKLIFRLLGDRRVSILAKVIPVSTIVYLFSPDPIMFPIIGAVDDVALLALGSYIFTELCPLEVVQEHLKALAGNATVDPSKDDVVDAETTDVN
jgi:uncharacterized membrane protein YkvA (DUF1232 family)